MSTEDFSIDEHVTFAVSACHNCGKESEGPTLRTAFDFAQCPHCKLDRDTGETFESWANQISGDTKFSIGEIVRINSGPTAFMLIESINKGRMYGEHFSGGNAGASITNCTYPAARELEDIRSTAKGFVESREQIWVAACDVTVKTLHEKMIGNKKIVAEKNLTAPDFLNAALTHMNARAVTYDKPNGERSMNKTVTAFNTITSHSLTEEQGWLFMGLLKMVRSQQGNFKADNYEDEAAYAALRGECAAIERGES